MSKSLHTTNGKPAIVDEQDFLKFRSRNWHVKYNKSSPLIYSVVVENGKRKTRILHREILGVDDPGKVVVHRDGDSFNFRRKNLFVVDRGKQSYSRKKIQMENRIKEQYTTKRTIALWLQ